MASENTYTIEAKRIDNEVTELVITSHTISVRVALVDGSLYADGVYIDVYRNGVQVDSAIGWQHQTPTGKSYSELATT